MKNTPETYFTIIIFCLFSLLAISHPLAATERATLIFAAEMTEISSNDKGGYPELASIVNKHRQTPIATFFIFGGGSLGPSILSSFDRGSHIIDILNSLEPDAMGIAKREFSFSEDELSFRAYEAAFPIVASNLLDPLTQGNLDGLVESVILEQGDYKLGFLSILNQAVHEEYPLKRVIISDPIAAIEQHANLLRQKGVDLIVLHYSSSYPFIDQLLDKGIVDISVRKDEHSKLSQDNNIVQNQRNIFLDEAGQIAIAQLEWDKDSPKSLHMQWLPQDLQQFEKDPQVLKQVLGYTDRLALLLDENIGIALTPMDTRRPQVRTQENSFGNFLTDAIKAYSSADIAIINGGTIRGEKEYSANSPLTRRDIARELPYRNRVALIEINGSQIITALENGFSLIEKTRGRYPQVSGMQITYNSKAPVGNRVVSVKINGAPLVPSQTYKLATSSYLANGGDGYSSFTQSKKIVYKNQMTRLISDIVINVIISKKHIAPELESRLVDINN